MFIIFGWLKEGEHRESLLNTYCYHCNNSSDWGLFVESEWVTFFEIKTIPFIKKHFLFCERCNDKYALSLSNGLAISKLSSLSPRKKALLHDQIVSGIEAQQLAGKSERQMEYIKTMREINKNKKV